MYSLYNYIISATFKSLPVMITCCRIASTIYTCDYLIENRNCLFHVGLRRSELLLKLLAYGALCITSIEVRFGLTVGYFQFG